MFCVVPPYFADYERQATKDAGAMAGLNVLRIMSEPTAAAIAYGMSNLARNGVQRYVMVVHVGGCKMETVLLLVEDGIFEILATNTEQTVCGREMDNLLLRYFAAKFDAKHKHSGTDGKTTRTSILDDDVALCRLRAACEAAKIALSSSDSATVAVDSLVDGKPFLVFPFSNSWLVGVDFSSSITRAQFEVLCSRVFDGVTPCIARLLRDAKQEKENIHDVIFSLSIFSCLLFVVVIVR